MERPSEFRKGSFSLAGKNALLTGAAGILGHYFAKGLAEMGANLILVDLNGEALEKLASEITQNFGGKVLTFVCDLTNPIEVKNLISNIEESWGEIHILHNNAASKGKSLLEFFRPFEEYSLENWREIMSVNIDSMFLMAQAVGKHMVDKKIKGSIIQTASIYGILAPDQRIYEGSEYMGVEINTPAVYSASKAAVVGLSNYLASYWAKNGIRVNTLTPGGMESGQNEVFLKNYSQRVPLARMGLPKELVGALVYLASDASSYVTGQNMVVDGGLSVW